MHRLIPVLALVVSISACKDKESSSTNSAPPETATAPEKSPAGEKPAEKPVDEALAKRCSQAIAKVSLDELMATVPNGKPSPGEQAIIDGVRKQSQAACESEGLSEEQAACLDAIKDVDTLLKAGDCPAIAAKKPSWLTVPSPEARKAVEEKTAPDAAPEP